MTVLDSIFITDEPCLNGEPTDQRVFRAVPLAAQPSCCHATDIQRIDVCHTWPCAKEETCAPCWQVTEPADGGTKPLPCPTRSDQVHNSY
jgi:hypothetical protein